MCCPNGRTHADCFYATPISPCSSSDDSYTLEDYDDVDNDDEDVQ